MKRDRVMITPFAADNIREAHVWLQVENPVYADKWLDGLKQAISTLETMPKSHAIAPESVEFEQEIRQMLYGRGTPWRIFFTINTCELAVHILHIRHGNRDFWRL
ncbi:type II toxin-antitoxin system RelE/ParE family toxin [Magnetococcales bacterium HHB-1]